jgi:hypothetical protein
MTRMRVRLIVLLALLGFFTAVRADSLDINLNDKAVEAAYGTYFRTAELSFGGFYKEDREDWVLHAGLVALGVRESHNTRSYAGLGGKLYYASVNDEDLLALGLGGLFRWFPGNGPVGLGASLFYAPEVVTALDGKKFWEFVARAEFEVVKETASLYLGFRKIRAELDNGAKVNLDDDLHIGIRIAF